MQEMLLCLIAATGFVLGFLGLFFGVVWLIRKMRVDEGDDA